METVRNLSEKEQKRRDELARRREAKEVGELDFNTNTLQSLMAYGDMPLTREELERENAALVLTPEEFQAIGPFDVILATGERTTLDPDDLSPDDILVLYPRDLGNSAH